MPQLWILNLNSVPALQAPRIKTAFMGGFLMLSPPVGQWDHLWITWSGSRGWWCIIVIKWDRVGKENNMFIGEYTHTMDEKRRVSLPSLFREELDDTVVLTRGLDRCIFLFPEAAWENIVAELAGLSFGDADARSLNRFLLSRARKVTIDKSGRILVPDLLAEFANLDKEVVFTGVNSRIELWEVDQWKHYSDEVESQADLLAQTLGDIGMI